MLEFGVSIENRGPLCNPENIARVAQGAEALGYAFVTVSDHVVLPRMPADNPGHFAKDWRDNIDFMDPLLSIMYVAGLTRRVRIGTSVLILPYRPPLPTAKALATLDVFSGGRVFLGVGTGWWREEFEALGIADHYASRADRTDEHIRIFRTLWTEPNPRFAGRFNRFEDIEFSPKPVQPAGPPIWVGGNNPRAYRRMAELGDVWHPSTSGQPMLMEPQGFGACRRKVVAAFEKVGRDPATLRSALRRSVQLLPPGSEPRDALAGPVEHVIAGVRAYRDQGLTHLAALFTTKDIDESVEQMERFAAEVIPHCR
ncbi:MAG: TIGR03619 family F420-dependent LLM class oxidoreductase [Candidatus Lambdaproteobacteria bacterium]|nr:TIGR03619 family F420-dependent LLM class oxidoreductase [Candidatus Lambdaproteobacteria bacterium]